MTKTNLELLNALDLSMLSKSKLTDKGVFEATSDIIYRALEASHKISSSKTNIAKTAFEIALKQLV